MLLAKWSPAGCGRLIGSAVGLDFPGFCTKRIELGGAYGRRDVRWESRQTFPPQAARCAIAHRPQIQLDAFPQVLDEDVVPPGPLAVHADPDVVRFEQAREFDAGELAILIGVEDLWAREQQSQHECLQQHFQW